MIQIMLIVCAAIITIIGGVLGILANKKKRLILSTIITCVGLIILFIGICLTIIIEV